MPSLKHDLPALLIRERPQIIAQVCHAVGLPFPIGGRVRVAADEAATNEVTDLRRDRTVVFTDAKGIDELVVCCETQTEPDTDKHWSWPVYLAKARYDHKCPAALIVFCANPATARWARKRIDLGHPGLRLDPIVVTSKELRPITEPAEAAESLQLTMLVALLHGNDPETAAGILEALSEALDTIPSDQAGAYAELMARSLPELAKDIWEQIMDLKNFEYTSDYANRLRAQGRAEGLAEGLAEGEQQSLYRVLRVKRIKVTERARHQIDTCTDLELLGRWLDQAVNAQTLDEVFAESTG